jgi:hypothetical protein
MLAKSGAKIMLDATMNARPYKIAVVDGQIVEVDRPTDTFVSHFTTCTKLPNS